MINCLPGPPQFDNDLAYAVYYGALARGEDENEALKLGILMDCLMHPSVYPLWANLDLEDSALENDDSYKNS